MANPWFRLYTEFAYDPKVQVLTETLQRRYVMALCLHCDGKLENSPDDEVALALRVTVDEWQTTKAEFVKRGLLTGAGAISGWNKRQYVSDKADPTAAERQKRYRERNKRNEPVTSRLPEAETDTEKKGKRGTRFSLDALPPDWREFCKLERQDLDPEKTFAKFADHWKPLPGARGVKLDWMGTWRNWVRSEKQTPGQAKTHQPQLPKPTPIGPVTETEYEFAKKMVKSGFNPSQYQQVVARYENQRGAS